MTPARPTISSSSASSFSTASLSPAAIPVPVPPTNSPSSARSRMVGSASSAISIAGLHYLVETTELRPISELQAQIELARPRARAARELSPADGATARMAAPPARQPEQPPASRPYFFRPDSSDMTVCLVYGNDSFAPRVLVHSTVPSGGGTPTDGLATGPVPLANRVWVPPGRAALVASMSSPTVTHPPLYLVTDTGKRFAVPDDDVLHALGYGSVTPSKLPASLVVRIPEGPALDASVARQAMAHEDQDPDGDD
ncbi:MAG TPA: type VII secretion protein EccB [Actinocatenispora sp.]